MARIIPPFLYIHTLHQDLAAASIKSCVPVLRTEGSSDLPWLIKWRSAGMTDPFWTNHTVCSTASQMQNLCPVYPPPPSPSIIWLVPPHPWRLISGTTLPGSIPRLPPPSHFPHSRLSCWVPTVLIDGPHRPPTQPASWVTASVHSAFRSRFTMNLLKIEILSFVCYLNNYFNSSYSALKVSVPWYD